MIMPPPQQIAEFLTPAPGQAGKVEAQRLGQLAQGGVEHRLAHALRQPLLFESERAEELPALAAEQVQIGAFQGTAAGFSVCAGAGSAARSSRWVCAPRMRPCKSSLPP